MQEQQIFSQQLTDQHFVLHVPEPIIKNQIQENQVNQVFTPQDSTPHCNTISESSPLSIHLTQSEEFEQTEQVDEEQE
ncbi:hypothetical protein, partial [Alteromonas stellipolaris]|uniref:hypothetical protein n=1 Tax=Alteromonas stellipolaris TaxID=233316 RepID=UPI001DED59C1